MLSVILGLFGILMIVMRVNPNFGRSPLRTTPFGERAKGIPPSPKFEEVTARMYVHHTIIEGEFREAYLSEAPPNNKVESNALYGMFVVQASIPKDMNIRPGQWVNVRYNLYPKTSSNTTNPEWEKSERVANAEILSLANE